MRYRIPLAILIAFFLFAGCKRPVRTGVITAYKGQKCYVYEIRRGDTLWGIAKRFSVTSDQIKSFNEITDATNLQIGKTLLIPAKGTSITKQTSSVPAKTVPASTPAKKTYSRPVVSTVKKTAKPSQKQSKPVFYNQKPASSSRFIWPANGKILTSFGAKTGVQNSDGIDIGVAHNSPVKAAGNGKVVFSDAMDGYGNIIIIDHFDGFFTLYACNSKNIATKDSMVKQGDIIAYSGSRNGTNLLHFQVRQHGQSRDPVQYLK